MNFLYTFITSFIYNYLIIWIVSLFSTKKRNLISILALSIVNIAYIAIECYYLWEDFIFVASNNALNEYQSYFLIQGGNILAIALAYFAGLVLLLDGKRIFKSRRQQQYANAVKNRSKVPTIISIVVLALLGAASLTYAIITTVYSDISLLLATFGAYGMALVFFGFAFYIFYINFTKQKNLDTTSTQSNVINATILNKTKVDVELMFILDLANNKYYFKGILDNNRTINYYLGNILNVYVLTDFGTIEMPEKKVLVKGIKVEKIDESFLREIKLSRVTNLNENFLSIMSNFERYHIRTVYLDANNNISRIVEK